MENLNTIEKQRSDLTKMTEPQLLVKLQLKRQNETRLHKQITEANKRIDAARKLIVVCEEKKKKLALAHSESMNNRNMIIEILNSMKNKLDTEEQKGIKSAN